jgi:hypothetical protein
VANQVVEDRHVVNIPADAVAGSAEVRVGLYPSGNPAGRLPVSDPGLASVEANSVTVAVIQITS